jgi:hypothetical protein
MNYLALSLPVLCLFSGVCSSRSESDPLGALKRQSSHSTYFLFPKTSGMVPPGCSRRALVLSYGSSRDSLINRSISLKVIRAHFATAKWTEYLYHDAFGRFENKEDGTVALYFTSARFLARKWGGLPALVIFSRLHPHHSMIGCVFQETTTCSLPAMDMIG